MPKEIIGILQAKTGFSIPAAENGIELYPLGRHLRGACGYIALDSDLTIADKFTDLNWDGVIFRDLIPVSRCDFQYEMDDRGVLIQCPECGDMYDLKMLKTVRTMTTQYKEIREGRKYRLSIIVQDEDYLNDIQKIVNIMKKTGIRLGQMKNSGHGLFVLRGWEIDDIDVYSGKNWRLLSDAVMPEGQKEIIIGKKIEKSDSFDKIRLRIIPRGTVINKQFSGFALGTYTGLGFGEIDPL